MSAQPAAAEGADQSHRGEGAPEEGDRLQKLLRLGLVAAVTVFLGVRLGLSTVAVILALVFMIFMHELGHYITARAAGMKVTEFFIGFGPRLWSFRRGETEYGLKAIPAGAYVRIIGMSNLEEVDPSEEHRTYRQQPYWRRLSVAVAGSTMHFLMAIVLLFVVLVGFGVSETNDRIGAITEDSAAAEAGLELGDEIVEVDERTFGEFSDLSAYLRARPGERVDILVDRDGERIELNATLGDRNPATGERVGFLGVGPDSEQVRSNPIDAAATAVSTTGSTIWQSARGIVSIFSFAGISDYVDTLGNSVRNSGEASVEDSTSRPVSIVGATRLASQATSSSLAEGLTFLALINVTIGVFNLVPLLPLDGGHVAIATYERIRSRGSRRYFADIAKMLPVTYAVFAVLVVLGVSSVLLDLRNPIANPFQP